MIKRKIIKGHTFLGIELGSTRIKASLTDDTYTPVASGSFEWENSYENGYWTYSLHSIHTGVRECFKNLCDNVLKDYGTKLETVGAIGISAMMHGYLPFDKNGNLLTPFRTWRNTTTSQAAAELTELFEFNIPQRWSIAHLYQAVLNNEEHVKDIASITTLAGYVYYLLTGRRETGIGDASGIFPVSGNNYNEQMLDKFDAIIKDKKLEWSIRDILPNVRVAGESGAYLTPKGAEFLDPTGNLKKNIPVCPPEGDAGTGMVATNAILPGTGNISAGTSVFSMLVTDKPLKHIYPQIDIVSTPAGLPVAMVHCNNCSGELDTWINIFTEFSHLINSSADKNDVYEILYNHAITSTGSKTIAYNYLSGEHITNISNGRPMYFRMPECKMTLADFIKAQLYSSFATLSLGMDILFKKENACATRFSVHGGLFKVKAVAQQILANALETPVSVIETSGEGGAWGAALLAAYMAEKTDIPLGDWLETRVFCNIKAETAMPAKEQVRDFRDYMRLYTAGLDAEAKLGEVE